jgi:hypothetical protein
MIEFPVTITSLMDVAVTFRADSDCLPLIAGSVIADAVR